ncbi:hypothetical protein [Bradyrhizobium sp. CCBAU 51765]|uniref:hypothetical protein n=1 Tax=Bradyrhizobium sp. CCBAU 51765 TaxID=1325102 RepID=UPI0018884628|nr:hypothetical protein [Bradyrhizobium sp. CCBAU 51765]QOZ08334.1 hypothetical protein XH96_12945 [Bradyrhizobium sp. CCBAU 51765]
MMIGKDFVHRLAITSSRKGLATAVVYGLTLTVRFTSATGDDIPPQSAQRAHPVISVISGDSFRLPYQDWSRKSARSIVFRQDGPTGCPLQ